MERVVGVSWTCRGRVPRPQRRADLWACLGHVGDVSRRRPGAEGEEAGLLTYRGHVEDVSRRRGGEERLGASSRIVRPSPPKGLSVAGGGLYLREE